MASDADAVPLHLVTRRPETPRVREGRGARRRHRRPRASRRSIVRRAGAHRRQRRGGGTPPDATSSSIGVEMRCHPDATRVANVAWGADAFPPPTVAARGGFDVVLGSDVVYSASSARTFLETAEGLMAEPGGVTVLAYIPAGPRSTARSRRPPRRGTLAESVAPRRFSPRRTPRYAGWSCVAEGACLLLLVRRKDDPSAVSAMSPPRSQPRRRRLRLFRG